MNDATRKAHEAMTTALDQLDEGERLLVARTTLRLLKTVQDTGPRIALASMALAYFRLTTVIDAIHDPARDPDMPPSFWCPLCQGTGERHGSREARRCEGCEGRGRI